MHAVTQAGEAWDYPQPFDNVTPTTCAGCVKKYAIRSTAMIRGRRIGQGWRSPSISSLIPEPTEKLNAILRAWYANGVLAAKIHKDGVPHERKYVVPGNWNDDPDAA